MSHQPGRKENNCLNCGATVQGRFCHVCGQENIVTHQGFWSLATHFVYDVLHFDGKFFETLKGLLFKPGEVPKLYVSGKRKSFLDPIRMYLFTSAVFFLFFFSVTDLKSSVNNLSDEWELRGNERLEQTGRVYNSWSRDSGNAALRRQLTLLSDTTYEISLLNKSGKRRKDTGLLTRFREQDLQLVATRPVRDTANDDAVDEDDWLSRKFEEQVEKAQEKQGGSMAGTIRYFLDGFLHKLPYLLFLSLPFFALILKLLYLRRRTFFYSDHAVFTLYHYIVSFILMLLLFLFRWLGNLTGWSLFSVLSLLSLFGGGVYLFIGMKRFYVQGWGKTTVKFLLLNFLAFVVLLFLLVLFVFLSIFNL